MKFWKQVMNEMAGDVPAAVAIGLFVITLMIWAPVIAGLFK